MSWGGFFGWWSKPWANLIRFVKSNETVTWDQPLLIEAQSVVPPKSQNVKPPQANQMTYTIVQQSNYRSDGSFDWYPLETFEDKDLAYKELKNLRRNYPHTLYGVLEHDWIQDSITLSGTNSRVEWRLWMCQCSSRTCTSTIRWWSKGLLRPLHSSLGGEYKWLTLN